MSPYFLCAVRGPVMLITLGNAALYRSLRHRQLRAARGPCY